MDKKIWWGIKEIRWGGLQKIWGVRKRMRGGFNKNRWSLKLRSQKNKVGGGQNSRIESSSLTNCSVSTAQRVS